MLLNRLCQSVNDLLALDLKYNLNRHIKISKNNCPPLQYPIRKMSITRVCQVLAQSRAEICCHRLIDSLLDCYKRAQVENVLGGGGGSGSDDNNSDSSSIEIYRALTRHMTPPIELKETGNGQQPAVETTNDEDDEDNNLLALDNLISSETKLIEILLDCTKTVMPKMLGTDGVKKSKSTGQLKVSHRASTKVIEYYEQILWGEVGNYLEHVVLWWGSAPLAARPPHSSQHLREWIIQFTPTARIPQVIVGALHSLADALGCHVTSTSWDQLFRLALVAAARDAVTSKNIQNQHFKTTETGQLFADMLHDLVQLNNQCEVSNEWIVGAPLDELPLVEQIPVLHRLDHSVHTTRLWAANETRKLANGWNVDTFFSIIHNDIRLCLIQLGDLRLDDHQQEIAAGKLGVHVQVCANMREKLVSEVKININKLKEVTKECIDVLATICRTVCLANLQMVFPKANKWRKTSNEMPTQPYPYVALYLDRVLLPVLEATNDYVISNTVLRIMCEAWLDYIYFKRIKFSQNGALQLLVDFDSVANWLINCPIITQAVRKQMLSNEVLRRCEGVGRILLRSPGEHIDMDRNQCTIKTDCDEEEEQVEEEERMPAEMYVPNQEQWLELRATRKRVMLLPALCCQIDHT